MLNTPFHLENSFPSFSFTRLNVSPFACDILAKQEARCDGSEMDTRRMVIYEISGMTSDMVGLV